MEDSVIILAQSEAEANTMRANAENIGETVRGTSVWTGPCPDGSFMIHPFLPFVRMSTPEYFFLRHVWEIDDIFDAVYLANELCGYFATNKTSITLPDGVVEDEAGCRTSKEMLLEYLSQIKDTPEGSKAYAVASLATNGLHNPDEAINYAHVTTLTFIGQINRGEHFLYSDGMDTLICVKGLTYTDMVNKYDEGFRHVSREGADKMMADQHLVWSLPCFYDDGSSIMTAISE